MNGILMQYFEWYLSDDGTLWQQISEQARELAQLGITGVWLPPASKGADGIKDVGYGVYDLYDLGEFNQKGTVRTKYGTKSEYLNAIKTLQSHNINVYADIVFDHMMGADYTESVSAYEENYNNRIQAISEVLKIQAWTGFNFPVRNNTYSSFKWNHTHFDGVDYDENTHKTAIFNFVDSPWDQGVGTEHTNFDYLMGADISFSNQEVIEEFNFYGKWFYDTTHVDGFRLDALKHIRNTFFTSWLKNLNLYSGRELFAVGEYWSPDLKELNHYLDACQNCMSLFDVPLHFNFFHACKQNGYFNMSKIFEETLVNENPTHAVTFVENHDTQTGQSLETPIEDWFKPLAYALILLRPQGYPCIFYGDYYGVPTLSKPGFKNVIDLFCKLRTTYLFGTQHDYFDHRDIIGWTFEGTKSQNDSGMAVLINDGPSGAKEMYIGISHARETFYDSTNNQSESVSINDSGFGLFTVDGGSFSVWIKQT